MIDHPVQITAYNPEWPGLFESERDLLLSACGQDILQLVHIGSTAVPGLPAKPIIDILAGVIDLETADRLVPIIKELGYEYISIYEVDIPERRYFIRPGERSDLVHIHMVEIGSDFWRRHLLFRDYLRTHPTERDTYGVLKQELAQRFRANRSQYTDAKTEFILRVQELAGFIPTHAPNPNSDP